MESTGATEMATIVQMHFVIFVFFRQFVMHITNGEQVNTSGNKCYHRKHHERQTIDVPVERDSQAAESSQFVICARCILLNVNSVFGRRVLGMIVTRRVVVVTGVFRTGVFRTMCLAVMT